MLPPGTVLTSQFRLAHGRRHGRHSHPALRRDRDPEAGKDFLRKTQFKENIDHRKSVKASVSRKAPSQGKTQPRVGRRLGRAEPVTVTPEGEGGEGAAGVGTGGGEASGGERRRCARAPTACHPQRLLTRVTPIDSL